MNITRGKIPCAKKVTIYGTEGIGKSTFASKFPDPIFIDTEDSTRDMDVSRFDKPTSWALLLQEVQYVIDHPECCKTLVLDTADWAEQLEIKDLCAKKGWSGLEDPGYGKGYQYSAEEFGKLLNMFSDVTEKGVNVVVTAHAWLKRVDLPDEMGSFDHWEMKTSKKVAPMLREWSDMVLFANYKTIVINVDGRGSQKGKNKAQGGKRVMYTNHHPCWDAKNRYGLPDELPFEYTSIAHIIEDKTVKTSPVTPSREPEPVQEAKQETMDLPINTPEPEAEPQKTESEHTTSGTDPQRPEYIPQALWDLMRANDVDEWDIENVVTARGYYPTGTTIKNYRADFIQAKLIGKWPQVYKMIKEMKEKDALVFN